MQNTLLIDFAAGCAGTADGCRGNNVANINTSGYKADRSLFEEYLRLNATKTISPPATAGCLFVQDCATFHDFSAGPD